jgi:hypothetical protein
VFGISSLAQQLIVVPRSVALANWYEELPPASGVLNFFNAPTTSRLWAFSFQNRKWQLLVTCWQLHCCIRRISGSAGGPHKVQLRCKWNTFFQREGYCMVTCSHTTNTKSVEQFRRLYVDLVGFSVPHRVHTDSGAHPASDSIGTSG